MFRVCKIFSAVHSMNKWVIVKDQSVIIFPALISCCRCAAKYYFWYSIKETGWKGKFDSLGIHFLFLPSPWKKYSVTSDQDIFFSLKEKSSALLVAEIVGNKCESSLPRVRYSSSTYVLTCNVCLQIRVQRSKAQMPSVPQYHILFYSALTSLWFLFSLHTTLRNTQLSIKSSWQVTIHVRYNTHRTLWACGDAANSLMNTPIKQ